jgi:RHS repeat-associated protein
MRGEAMRSQFKIAGCSLFLFFNFSLALANDNFIPKQKPLAIEPDKWCAKRAACSNTCENDSSGQLLTFSSKEGAFNYIQSISPFFVSWEGSGGPYGPFPNECYQRNFKCNTSFQCSAGAFAHHLGCPKPLIASGSQCICPSGYVRFSPSICAPLCPPDRPLNEQGQCAPPQIGLGPACPKVGNPIALGGANKFQVETDADFGALKIERIYNSRLVYYTEAPRRPARVGENWLDHYDRTIQFYYDVRGNISVDAWAAFREDGKRYLLRPGLGGTFTIEGRRDLITRTKDEKGQYNGYEWKFFEDDSVERYDIAGKLTSITDRHGRTVTLTYDEATANLIKVTDYLGNSLTYTWGGSSIASISHSNGQVFNYSYNGSLMSRVTFPTGKGRSYHYEDSERHYLLSGITNEDGVRYVTWKYDPITGRPISSEGVAGADKVQVTYNTPTQVSVKENGVTQIYNFSAADINTPPKLQSVDNPSANASLCSGENGTTFVQDAYGLIQTTDVKGNVVDYIRDNLGREIQKIESKGTEFEKITTTDYHPQFNAISKVTEPDKVTTFNYDDRGNILEKRITYSDGSIPAVWSYGYDSNSLMVTEDGPGPDTEDKFSYAYDGQGRKISKTDALGNTTLFSDFNYKGEPTKITLPNGVVKQYILDHSNRLLAKIVDGKETKFEYDGNGDLVKITYPDLSFETFSYSGGFVASHVTRQGFKFVYSRDLQGDIVKTEKFDSAGILVSTYTKNFDYINKSMTVSQNAVSQTQFFNNACEVIKESDSLGHSRSYTYDKNGNMISSKLPNGLATFFSYDNNGKMIEAVDPRNLKTTYVYNKAGQQIQVQNPDSGIQTSHYFGTTLIKMVDARGVITENSYDNLGRLNQTEKSLLIKVKNSGQTSDQKVMSSIRYTFNDSAGGQVSTIENGDSTIVYEYDAKMRVQARIQSVKGRSLKTGYTYNTNGDIASIIYPSGKVVEYIYEAGKVAKISVDGNVVADEIQYHVLESPLQWKWGNGSPFSREINGNGNVTAYSLGSGTATIQYDLGKRPTQIFDPVANLNHMFSFDLLDQLKTVDVGGSLASFTYDNGGNLLVPSFGVSSTSNRFISSVKNIDYDAAGNMIKKGHLELFYNPEGRLSSIMQIKSDGNAVKIRMGKYLYNALGERVYRLSTTETGAQRLYYTYNEYNKVLGEYSDSSEQEFIYLNDTPIAVIDDGDIFYIQTDHLGTPRALINQENKVVWYWQGEAYGNSLPDSDPDKDGNKFVFNLRFPGQVYDQESGLHYNYHRDYDPSLGRYVESDPKGIDAGFNTFAYVNGSPVSGSDPLGLFKITAFSPQLSPGLSNDFPVEYPDNPNECILGAHGDQSGIDFEDGEVTTTPTLAQVAAFLKKRCPPKPCMKIRLYSCSTGADPTGFAQQLANYMGVQVTAPNTLAWGGGNYIFAKNPITGKGNINATGSWNTFCPKAGISACKNPKGTPKICSCDPSFTPPPNPWQGLGPLGD